MEHGKENPPSYSQAPAAPYPEAPAQYPPAPPHPSSAHTYPPNNSGQTVQPQQVVIVGGCPRCGVGVLEEKFTLGGWCCCFWLFPLGLICLYSMRQKRCIHCHQRFQ